MRIVSVDPGKTGAVILIENEQPLAIYDMPTIKRGSKTLVDVDELAKLIHRHSPKKIVTEQVGASPRMGVSGAFNFGYAFCAPAAIAAGAGIPWFTITPQKWKTFFGLLKKDKDAARLKVIEMFPHLAKEFKFKNSVDKADALLLGLAWLRLQKRSS